MVSGLYGLHRATRPPFERISAPRLWQAVLERYLRDETAVGADLRVPGLVGVLELGELLPALGEAHRLRRVGRDAVLVPGQVPGDGDDQLVVDAGEVDDARLRRAEAPREALDRAPVGACIEEVGRLDDAELGLGEPAQERLRDNRRRRGDLPRSEERSEAAALPGRRNGGRRGSALLDPPVLERELLAERADVEVVRPAVGREAQHPLAHEEPALADRALARRRVLRHPHMQGVLPKNRYLREAEAFGRRF